MINKKIDTVEDLVKWRLCIGCGACSTFCENITLYNDFNIGILPKINKDGCKRCGECLSVCPGYYVHVNMIKKETIPNQNNIDEVGPILDIWEGYAADPQIRFTASSGGILTALAIFFIEKGVGDYVLHTGSQRKHPWLNETRISKIKEEVLECAGSRYAPSSPCDWIQHIGNDDSNYVFIGKPCDVAGFRLLEKKEKESYIGAKFNLLLSFFCAGTPSVQGTLSLLRNKGIDTEKINKLAFRGYGWPGGFKAIYDNDLKEHFTPYEEAWSYLARYRPLRCHFCPDGLGTLADISCGDAWHLYNNKKTNPGVSLILVRSKRGQEIINKAREEKYIVTRRSSIQNLLSAQKNLINRNRQIYGRYIAFKMFNLPTPKYDTEILRYNWNKLSFIKKIKSIFGTIKRILKRSYF